MKKAHFTCLEKMYLSAPINEFYQPTIQISEGKSVIEMEVKEEFFHAADGVHGSVYFKMLDDAAFFAANSVVTDVFVLTASFDTKLIRPINSGKLIAKGELLQISDNKLEANAKLFNEQGKLIASGGGLFVKSQKLLNEISSYKNS